MSDKLYLYPVWVRLWHLVNALLCILLILTGLSMQYAGQDTLMFRFDLAVSIHNVTGILLTINYFIFIVGNLTTNNGRQYVIKKKNFFKNLILQMRYYAFGIFKKENPPFPITNESKFNPLQRFSYVGAIYICLSILVLTGWFYFFPAIIPDHIFGVGGILINAMLHVSFGFVVSFFLIIHVYFCTIGITPWANFMSIINGWHKGH